MEFIVPAIIGLITGAIGALIAPWVNWGIEKRKIRLAARREFITTIRHVLELKLGKKEFRESAHYSRIRPFLSERTRKEIESDTITFQMGGRGEGMNNFSSQVLDELHLLEKKWKLL